MSRISLFDVAIGSSGDYPYTAAEERVESKGAALPVVICPQYNHAVLEHTDESQEPEDDRGESWRYREEG